MRTKFVMVILVLAISLSACGSLTPAPAQTPLRTPAAVSTHVLWPAVNLTSTSGGAYPAVVLLARADLASRLGISPEKVQVTAVKPQDWPDACLGISPAGGACAEVITPGYLVNLVVGTALYQYRTDMNGKIILPEL